MAVAIKGKKQSGKAEAADNPGVGALVHKFNQDYGKGVAIPGNEVVESPRIPTGIFPLDLALGGGIPEGRVTQLFGVPGSCKSNIALKLVANKQRLSPDLKCIWIDIEHSYDAKWAAYFGVDTEKLIVVNPDFGEQVVDMTEALLFAPDCGLVVLDSLAALSTQAEMDKSAEAFSPGAGAQMSKKMFNKSVAAMRKAEQVGLTPTFVFINQMRHKIGVMFGSPEYSPGGFTPEHMSSLILKCYGKPVKDDKVSETIPCVKDVHVVIKKHKIPIVATECKFEMAMIPHKGLNAGDVDSWNTLWAYLNACGLVVEDKKKWVLADPATGLIDEVPNSFDTQKALRSFMYDTPGVAELYQRAIITREIDRVYGGMKVVGG